MKILWAVDAFDGQDQSLKQQWAQIQSLTAKPKIQAVYVLSPEQLDLPVAYTQTWFDYYKPLAEKAFESRLKCASVANEVDFKVLSSDFPSQRKSIKVLLDYAHKLKFDLIVLGTHGRKGIKRTVLGSFTESFLLQSDIPVLTFGPEISESQSAKEVLYLTDLSDESKMSFDLLMKQFVNMKPKLKILTVIPRPFEPVFQSGVYLLTGGWVPVPTFMESEASRIKVVGKEWVQFAKQKGFEASFECEVGSYVVAATLERIKKLDGFVALASQSTVLQSAILGSITRELVRQSSKPVWVVHPK